MSIIISLLKTLYIIKTYDIGLSNYIDTLNCPSFQTNNNIQIKKIVKLEILKSAILIISRQNYVSINCHNNELTMSGTIIIIISLLKCY